MSPARSWVAPASRSRAKASSASEHALALDVSERDAARPRRQPASARRGAAVRLKHARRRRCGSQLRPFLRRNYSRRGRGSQVRPRTRRASPPDGCGSRAGSERAPSRPVGRSVRRAQLGGGAPTSGSHCPPLPLRTICTTMGRWPRRPSRGWWKSSVGEARSCECRARDSGRSLCDTHNSVVPVASTS
jgi:hypothetical protein